ncbi:pentapeptide repeat-containing protein [Streptomyces bohaiensis]|uniref:pentapeptide repeat-containing protein n=1 Tax=Streptomyces bohaiensis TaxID=1431344 RepID=UPI003B7C4DCC
MTTVPALPEPPRWPHCGQGADPGIDPVGCRGRQVGTHSACLAHLTKRKRDRYLRRLNPGDDIDHRGTPFTPELLTRLLNALTDPTTEAPHLGDARFEEARFSGAAWFDRARFSGAAWFDRARFSGRAGFDRARFSGDAWFVGTRFSDRAVFVEARFSGDAMFGGARFSGSAWFGGARFSGDARFVWVQFSGDAMFGGARFSDRAVFGGARFSGVSGLGPLVCGGEVVLSGAVFGRPVVVEVAARRVVCVRTVWESTATLRVRHASVDLTDAVLSAPVAVVTHAAPFTDGHDGGPLLEDRVTGPSTGPRVSEPVRVLSVRGVDAAHLVLTETDLSDCRFAGAFHLDQLRLEGDTTFAPTPAGRRAGVRRWVRFTKRRVLAEEHHWRAHRAGQAPLAEEEEHDPELWRSGPDHGTPSTIRQPAAVAAVYRQLRKAFEDGKDSPGAADFYYGECEMRRRAASTSVGERFLLWAYWALSGYGLRASRAFGWLAATMALTVALLMGFGLPVQDVAPATTGTVQGEKVDLTTKNPDPVLNSAMTERASWDRAEKATRVAVNSVVFRSSGQNLTTAGTYIEMASRLFEPTLVALGILAIRGRIRR